MAKKLLFLLLLFSSLYCRPQSGMRKNLKGKIITEVSNREGINIVNIETEKYAVTDSDGYFSIPVQVCDTLMFSAVQFKALKVVVTDSDIQNDMLFVHLEIMAQQLNEVVVVQYKNINAVSLGIIPAGQRSYTPAERKLKAGTGIDAKVGLNSSISVDPLLNMLSGRSAMLKRDVATEKKEFWLQKIQELYDDNFFAIKLKIPIDYIKGFQYYLVEDKRFVDTLSSKNKTMSTFLVGELAIQYISLNCL